MTSASIFAAELAVVGEILRPPAERRISAPVIAKPEPSAEWCRGWECQDGSRQKVARRQQSYIFAI
ncbi:MAG: hypothetical protein ACOYNR_14390 [Blastocatellia bacterium]